MELREYLLHRINRVEIKFSRRMEKIKRYIKTGKLDFGEKDRLWLDKWTNGENGLDICCGDLLIGEAEGVDSRGFMLGSIYASADGCELAAINSNSIDFIVTNYLDVFPSPLKVLNEWYRILKQDSILALVCCNANKYDTDLGPFINNKRTSCFTLKTISFYLTKAGFKVIESEEEEYSIRVAAKKL